MYTGEHQPPRGDCCERGPGQPSGAARREEQVTCSSPVLVPWKMSPQGCAGTWLQQVPPGLLKAKGCHTKGIMWPESPPPLNIVSRVEREAVLPLLWVAWLHPALFPGHCLALLLCSWSISEEIGSFFCFGDMTTKAKAEAVYVALLGARSLSSHGNALSWGPALRSCLKLSHCDF